MTIARAGLLIATIACLLLCGAQPAFATFHLVSIDEVYPGSVAHPDSGFVELEPYEAGQNFVGNHSVTLYDAGGNLLGTFTFPTDLPGEGANQQTMLVGDSGVSGAFGVTPDLVDAAFNVPASGGAACWDTLDCVAWGNFHGATVSPVGLPADGAGIPDGAALQRRTSGGTCANLLDEADDKNESDSDFVDKPPSPQSYATVPPPASCSPPSPTPTTTIDSKPPASTNATSASFQFHSTPSGAAFECRLDLGAYAACDSGSIAYPGPLAEGLHSFRVRATNGNGTGAPAAHSWNVDLTPPAATITSHPADPSPGKSASFRYSSNEGGAKFECRLSPLEASFSACNTQPRTYVELANGDYEFEVRASDVAGNLQPTPTAFGWTVDNALLDTTPPETTIVSKPADPSDSPIASFSYGSNEPGSTFQCRLDGGTFSGCPASGITYFGLASGPHAFSVRAIDPTANVDPTPAGYSFQVVFAPPSGISPAVPPLAPRTTARHRRKRRRCHGRGRHRCHRHRGHAGTHR